MTWQLAAWYESIDPAGALVPIAATPDQSLTVNGDNITVPNALPNIIGSGGVINDASGAQVQFQAPSLRTRTYPDLEPFEIGAAVFSNPIPWNYHGQTPTPLEAQEDLQAFFNSNPAAAAAHYGFALLSDGPVQPAGGRIQSVRATATIQAAVATWASDQMTFGQNLQVGNYRVVGLRCRGTGLVASRLIFQDQVARPGGPCPSAIDSLDAPFMRFGAAGVWGQFHSTNPPQLEVIGGTGTAQTVILDLVRI